jgi:hypothetical protein
MTCVGVYYIVRLVVGWGMKAVTVGSRASLAEYCAIEIRKWIAGKRRVVLHTRARALTHTRARAHTHTRG